MKQAKSILCGLLIVALGVIIGGNALNIFNLDIFFEGWWTLFIIIPCFFEFITASNKTGSLVGIAIGVLLLLAAQDVLTFEVAGKLIFALVVIVFGLTIAFRGVFSNKCDKDFVKKVKANKNKEGVDEQIAVFAGNDRVYKNEEFTGANLTAIFGGVDLDLIDAKFTKDTVIKAICAFGGISIRVPENVQVKVKSGFVFGGASDDRKNVSDKAKYTIYVDAGGCFGGISVEDKSKK
jgi:predicted membrane protein